MKKRNVIISGVLLMVVVATLLQAGDFINPGFETEFGLLEDRNVWGDYGESFGEVYQVDAGKENGPDDIHEGSRALLINVPQNSWNGIWQQLPWEEQSPFSWTAHYLIKGGDLPVETATFMKLEFLDGLDQVISDISGDRHTQDTAGKWLKDTVSGVTPKRTRSLRFVLIGGNNPDEESVFNRIYWDDSDTNN